MKSIVQLSSITMLMFCVTVEAYAVNLTEPSVGEAVHIHSDRTVSIYTNNDSTGNTPAGEYFNVYFGSAATNVISAGGDSTKIATAGGNSLTLNDSGLSLTDLTLSGVADGTLSESSTEGVNGSQLFETNQQVSNLGTQLEQESQNRINGDAATLTAANTYTDSTATTLRSEAAKESARLDTAIADGDAATLASANSYTDGQLTKISNKLDDVEKTAYRGVAIALAAQQQVPNIKPGQVALFGGVGHYQGESAGALGVVGIMKNGRTSLSSAIGVASGGDIGGRVGIAYVFGGN